MSQLKIRKKSSVPHNPDKPTPEGVFKQAESFSQAAHVLFVHATQNVGHHPQLLFPMTVCEAFSLELFLKCLILLEGAQYKATHDLEQLFGQLSIRSKEYIRFHCEPRLANMQRLMDHALEQEQQKTGIPIPRVDFDAALRGSRKAFEAFRYFHEGSTLKSREGWLGHEIVRSVRDRIIALRPEWKNISFVRPSSPPPSSPPPTPPRSPAILEAE